MSLGTPTLDPVAPPNAEPVFGSEGGTLPGRALRQIGADQHLDNLTHRTRGLDAQNTGLFRSGTVTLWLPISGNRVRIKKLLFMMTEDAAIAGGAADITLEMLDNLNPTGLKVVFFVPTVSVSGIGTEIMQVDLGEGWVSQSRGGTLSIIASAALTAGQFLVTALGEEEAGF